MKKYDVIVVGAGHNGLTNAAFLAKAGLDVLCVEKNEYIGGATVSRNLYKDCCIPFDGPLSGDFIRRAGPRRIRRVDVVRSRRVDGDFRRNAQRAIGKEQ